MCGRAINLYLTMYIISVFCSTGELKQLLSTSEFPALVKTLQSHSSSKVQATATEVSRVLDQQ